MPKKKTKAKKVPLFNAETLQVGGEKIFRDVFTNLMSRPGGIAEGMNLEQSARVATQVAGAARDALIEALRPIQRTA